jgi:hypothetical protein
MKIFWILIFISFIYSKKEFNPNLPLIPCSKVPDNFMSCFFELNSCEKFGANSWNEVLKTGVKNCTIFQEIECFGEKNIQKTNQTCIL